MLKHSNTTEICARCYSRSPASGFLVCLRLQIIESEESSFQLCTGFNGVGTCRCVPIREVSLFQMVICTGFNIIIWNLTLHTVIGRQFTARLNINISRRSSSGHGDGLCTTSII